MNLADLKTRAHRILVQPRSRKIGWWVGGLIVAFGLFGFFAAPPIAKSILVDKLGEALHRKVSIENISINPFTLSAEIGGFSVKSAEGQEVVGFDTLALNLETSSLFRGGPVVKEFRLNGPRLQLTRIDENRYDISDLIDEWSQPRTPTAPEGPPARFSVNNIQISNGKLVLADRHKGVTHTVSDLVIRLPFVSSMPSHTAIFVLPHISAKVNGAPLLLEGRSKPFDASHESELALNLEQVNLVPYLGYSPVKLPFTVKSAALDTELKLLFKQAGNASAVLKLTGALHLKDLAASDRGGAPLLAWKRLDVGLDGLDLLEQRLALGEVKLTGLEQSFRVDNSGKLNWLEALTGLQGSDREEKREEKKAESGKPFTLAVRRLLIDNAAWSWREDGRGKQGEGQQLRLKGAEIKDIAVDPAQKQLQIAEVSLQGADARLFRDDKGVITLPPAGGNKKSGAPWKIGIAKLALSGSSLRYEELGEKGKLMQQVDDLQLSLEGFSSEPGSKAKVALSAKVNQKGGIKLGGNLQLQPLNAALEIDVTGVPLLPAQPFFSDKLNITLLRGQFSGKGNLNLSEGKEGPAGDFKGQIAIDDLHTIDKLNSADFLKWKTLTVGAIDTRLQPFALSIGDIVLSDFYARMIVSPEGKLNLSQIVRQPEDAKPTAQAPVADEKTTPPPAAAGKAMTTIVKAEPPKPVPPIKIDKISFKNGRVNFSDRFVKPNYSVNVTKIGGRINGLSSAANTLADLELSGGYGNAAPVEVKAKLNPLAAKKYLDLKAEIRGVDLTTLSTYSGKYAGYAIEKGKLSLFVVYKLENNLLSAENRVFLDQLTFGDKVDSPDATSLPVKLAVALLKNMRGEIDINLPVSGSLEDPQFSVGGVIVRVIVNLFVKAVTSPFALLGSLFGGGEDLSQIEFAAGQSRLSPEALKKVEAMAKAMNDRPALKLEITGRVDSQADREGGKRAAIDRAVRAEKQKDLIKKGVETGSLQTIEVDAKEYPEYLKRVYSATKFSKPRNLIGLQKSLPVEEMEDLLIANTEVTDDDMRQLGMRRGQVVQAWLVGEGKVAMERVFLMAPRLSSEAKEGGEVQEGEKKVSASRVDFSLR